jgi:hypothetical protein
MVKAVCIRLIGLRVHWRWYIFHMIFTTCQSNTWLPSVQASYHSLSNLKMWSSLYVSDNGTWTTNTTNRWTASMSCVLSSTKFWKLANKILLWGIQGEQHSILKYVWPTRSYCERSKKTGSYSEGYMAKRILSWSTYGGHNPIVWDLKQTGSYSEGYMANRILFSGICGKQDPTVRDL